MRKWLCLLLAVLMLVLAACGAADREKAYDNKEDKETNVETEPVWGSEQGQLSTEPANTPTGAPATSQPAATSGTEATTGTNQGTIPATTEATTKPAAQPEPATHSPLYISGVETENVIRWFNEVVLDAEFVNSGNATVVQKWDGSISYALLGTPTDADRAVVSNMAATLNGISGFPGMYETSNPDNANLKIYFVTESEMLEILGNNFSGCDGGVTFWYNGNNAIYKGDICIRTDLDQYVRNSVIQEEIYNGLGPVQDTDLRSDSLIYSGYSTPQQMTQVDLLIVKLLYHPDIKCGMSATECEKVIRKLYY